MRYTTAAFIIVGLAHSLSAAETITVPGPEQQLEILTPDDLAPLAAQQALQASDAARAAAERDEHTSQIKAMQEAIDELKALLASHTHGPDSPDPGPITPIPPPDGIPQSLLGLEPNTGGFFGAPVQAVLAGLTPPTDFDRGNSYPQSMLEKWCGAAFAPDILSFVWICSGHNDGNSSAVLGYSVSSLAPFVLAQSFNTPDTMPDGSPVTRGKCPAPRTWGDGKGPGGLHTYGGIHYRADDNSVYVAGGFPYTCGGAIDGRRTDVQKFSLDSRTWSVVRSNIAHEGKTSSGGSNSYDLQLLSDDNWMLLARSFTKIMNQDGEYTYHQAGSDQLKGYTFTVKIGQRTDTDKPHDQFLAYDRGKNLRYVTAYHGGQGIAIGKPIAYLPNDFEKLFIAGAYVPEWNTVVFWDSASTLVFVNLETNEVREAAYDFPGYKGFANLGPGKLQYLGGGLLGGISCFECGMFAFRMPDNIEAVTQPPEPQAQDLQAIVDRLSDGATLTLPAGVYDAVRIKWADFTLGCEPGAKIQGEVNGQGVILQEGPNLTVQGCHIKARGGTRGIWGGNGAVGLTAIGNYFEGGADGILTCTSCGGHYQIVDNIFDGNGSEASSGDGAGHGFYISSKGAGSTFYAFGNTFKKIKHGHAIKSRASESTVINNTIEASNVTYSRAMDFPMGGVVLVEGNTIAHDGDRGNDDVMCYGCETWRYPRWPENSLVIKDNVVTCSGDVSKFLNVHESANAGVVPNLTGNTITACGVEIDDNRGG